MSIADSAKNGIILGGCLQQAVKNSPEEYRSRRRQYMGEAATEFVHKYAKYATDYFDADVQGLDPNDPDGWETVQIRMADISTVSAATLRRQDDYKIILFADESIDYVRLGTKIRTMGSMWLVVNPQNISSAVGCAIIQRCRTVWNWLDWYGRMQSEPLCVEKGELLSNDSDMQEYALITKGYVNVVCQRNEATKNLATNSRIILGSGAYKITGFGDFTQEFTGDYDSVRLLEFAARYEPPNLEIDDMERHIAGGKNFSWELRIDGRPTIREGQTTPLSAVSVRNGEFVSSTADRPVSYLWCSSDEDVILMRPDGVARAMGGGECTVRCTLAQNPEIFAEYEMTVEPAAETEVLFTGSVPKKLGIFESVTIPAAYFENGEETGRTVEFSFEGPDSMAYSVDQNQNSVTVMCWKGDNVPLRITAKCGESSISAEIELEGI